MVVAIAIVTIISCGLEMTGAKRCATRTKKQTNWTSPDNDSGYLGDLLESYLHFLGCGLAHVTERNVNVMFLFFVLLVTQLL